MAFNDDRYDADEEQGDLELAKTRLLVEGDDLQRRNAKGGLLLRIPLVEVESIELRARFDPVCLLFLTGAVGVAAIAYFVSDYIILTCILYLAAIAMAILAFFGFVARSIVVRTPDGETAIQCDDTPDEAECFVISVRHLLRTRKGTGPRIARHPESDTGFRE